MSSEELEELLELYEEKEKAKINYIQQTPDACKYCSCNPKNGGSGVCNCIIGVPKITC